MASSIVRPLYVYGRQLESSHERDLIALALDCDKQQKSGAPPQVSSCRLLYSEEA